MLVVLAHILGELRPAIFIAVYGCCRRLLTGLVATGDDVGGAQGNGGRYSVIWEWCGHVADKAERLSSKSGK
jgi:hypothetical protein